MIRKSDEREKRGQGWIDGGLRLGREKGAGLDEWGSGVKERGGGRSGWKSCVKEKGGGLGEWVGGKKRGEG